MRAVWVNDIHLDFLAGTEVDRFLRSITEESPDVVLAAGDISTARQIVDHLKRFEELVGCPICFVLGNHDYYHGSVARVRAEVSSLCEGSKRLFWLNESGVYPLTQSTAIVGHDGWGDARLGNFDTSPIELSDFFLIDELTDKRREDLVRILRRLGDEAAAHFRAVLPEALESYRRVVLLTHVPPFPQSTWYDGKVSNDDWLPFFCCHAAGEVLKETMSEHPDCDLTVLCGHTHGGGEVEIMPNLRVVTGGAEYRKPEIQAVFTYD